MTRPLSPVLCQSCVSRQLPPAGTVQTWGLGNFLEEAIEALKLRRGVGIGVGGGHEGWNYCSHLPIEQMQTLTPGVCKLFIQSHKSQVSLALAPTKETPKCEFGACQGI